MQLSVEPLTAERWPDVVKLFGERGACGGCWCMFWRQSRAEFEARKGTANRRGFRRLVAKGPAPGLLAYADGLPVGWCAVGPRVSYTRLERSRTLKGGEEAGVWCVTCFFVARPCRRRGVTVALLRAAAAHARDEGARILEGYPVIPRRGRLPDAFAYTGLVSSFRQAGFQEASRPSASRAIMRLSLLVGHESLTPEQQRRPVCK